MSPTPDASPTAKAPAFRFNLAGRGLRTLGPGSVSSVLKIALDVAYLVLALAVVAVLLTMIAALFVLPSDMNLTVTSETGGRQLPLTRPLVLFGLGSVAAYLGGFVLILRQLRKVFRTLTLGDPFQPENVNRLRVIGLTLAVVAGGSWASQSVASRLTHGIVETQGIGPLVTPAFSVLVVFVLAEVFREGARLRREAELTI